MSPFLARLPGLSPAERALAVHLGVFPRDGRTAAPSTYAVNNFATAVTDAGRPDPSQGSLGRRSPQPEPVSNEPRRRPGSEGGLAPAVRRSTATLRPVARSGVEEALAGVRKSETPRRPAASPGFSEGNRRLALARGYDPGARRKPEPQPKPAQAAPAPTPVPAEAAVAQAAVPPPAGSVPQDVPQAPAVTSFPTPLPQFQLQPQPQSKPAEVQVAAVEPPAPPPAQPQAVPESQPKPADVQIAAVEPSAPPPAQPQSIPESQPKPADVQIAAVEPSAPPPQSEAVPTGSRLADLSATLADIGEPERAPARTAEPKSKPAAAAAKKPKPEAPAEPSRAWVQIAVGAAKTALPREYARLKAKAPKLLAARGAWTAPLNATNRLLVGPFASAKEAQAFVNQLKAEDLNGFAWTSPAGQKVEKLPAK
jgi:hypothetical protein